MLHLIPDAKLAWRFASVQAALLLTVLSAVQLELLPLIQPLVPPEQWPYVSAGIALLIIVLRVIPQPALETPRAQLELDALEALQDKPLAAAAPDADMTGEEWDRL